MSALSISAPFPTFTDVDGLPIESGYIYIGTANLNPETSPISVYWDAALTQLAAQPIRTVGGYPANSGTPARLYVDSDYSIRVMNKNGSVVYSAPAATERYSGVVINGVNAQNVVYDPPFTGGVQTNVEAELSNTIYVTDFGAFKDGTNPSATTAAIQAAINYAKASSNVHCIEFPTGNYAVNAPIEIKGGFGDGLTVKGNKSTVTGSHNGAVFDLNGSLPSPAPEYRLNVLIQDFTVVGSGKANTGSRCVQIVNGANVQINNCILRNAYKGLHGYGALICNFIQLNIRDNETGVEFLDTASFAPNDIHFVNCQIIVNTIAVRAINFDYGSWNFYGCEIEGNNLSGNATDGVRVCEFFNAGEVNFIGCHFETNPGQYNLYYSSPQGRHLNIIGCKMIPGDTTGSVIYMVDGELFVTGSHVAQNVGSNIYLSSGVAAVIVGDTAGTVTGTLTKLTRLKDGRIQVGGATGTTAGITAKNSATSVAADFEGSIRFINASNTRLGYITESGIVLDASSVYRIDNGYGAIQFMRTGKELEPGSDNQYTLGSGALRWSVVYAGTGTINTSDEREKQDIAALDDAEKRVAVALKGMVKKFRFKDAVQAKGDDARIHIGVIAQDVMAAFEAEGLDPMRYAIVCYDEWDAELDDDSHEIRPAGNRYGVRYEELLAFIISAL